MNHQSEVTAAVVESVFGEPGASYRFANFCNAVLVAETDNQMASLPVLSEKQGADGSFDGEWDVRATAAAFSSPFAQIGWNVFQFKARGITGAGRKKAVSELRSNCKGALKALPARLKTRTNVERYALFTNLQLGLQTQSTTERGATLSKDRAELETATREESSHGATIQIVDAAQLAALVNKHPVLRLTYFTPNVARSWDEKWNEEKASKDYKVSVPFVGREREVAQVSAWIADPTVKVIAVCGPSGMGKTRLALETTRRERFRTTIVDVAATPTRPQRRTSNRRASARRPSR